jgi:hypothetical protein
MVLRRRSAGLRLSECRINGVGWASEVQYDARSPVLAITWPYAWSTSSGRAPRWIREAVHSHVPVMRALFVAKTVLMQPGCGRCASQQPMRCHLDRASDRVQHPERHATERENNQAGTRPSSSRPAAAHGMNV